MIFKDIMVNTVDKFDFSANVCYFLNLLNNLYCFKMFFKGHPRLFLGSFGSKDL